jgi:MerR family transcriptional regulator, light-induced transcriptional regulator
LSSLSVAERFRLGQKLAAVKDPVAQTASDEFLRDHPDWLTRYGEPGRKSCTDDFRFHIEFLAGAIDADSPDAFASYSRWTARMLAARGITAHTLAQCLVQLEKHLAPLLLPEQAQTVGIFLTTGREALEQPASPLLVADTTEDALALTRSVFLSAILGGQRKAALAIVDQALLAGHSHIDIYVHVFTAALHHVGELWESNKISVAQEHMATSITQYAIASIYPRLVPAEVHRGSMVVTGVAGELHQIGANLVADAMEAKGWAVQFLGSNLPDSAVVAAVEETSATVLCISTTLVANLPAVVELVGAVRGKLGERAPKIVLGGSAYLMTPEFGQELGAAETITDLRRGLAVLCA